MIWTADAKKLLEELNQGDSILGLDSLTIKAGETSLMGRGTLQRKNGRFHLTARFSLGSVPGPFSQAHFSGMQAPRLYSRDDFWTMEATTSGGINFECKVAPPHGWKDRSDGVKEIRCSVAKLDLIPKLLDATDFGFVEEFLKKVSEHDSLEGKSIGFSQESSEPVSSKFHAILPGVKCLLAEHSTTTECQNVFLPTATSEKLDTYVDEGTERRIGLVGEDGNLHVYLELTPGEASEEDENASFSALLDAVAFTHGCQPFPMLKEYSRGGRVVSCQVGALEDLKMVTIKPIGDHFAHFHTTSRSMLGVAFRFFQGEGAIVSRIRKAMWLYRDAASNGVPLRVQVLTACTLLEGLVKALFDAHGLKGPVKAGEDLKRFAATKREAMDHLMKIHADAGFSDKAESDWSRLAGWLNGCGYVRPKERMKAVADVYGFPWAGDVEEIQNIWNRHRNGLAHGAEAKTDFESMGHLFQGWSRLSGAIHRFILAEMGYVGPFSYSPMEPGLVEMEIQARAEDSVPQVRSEETEFSIQNPRMSLCQWLRRLFSVSTPRS